MVKIAQVGLLLHNVRLQQLNSKLESFGMDDFYSTAHTNLMLYTLYIAKADGEADEDELEDILEVYAKSPELAGVVKGAQKSFLNDEFDTIKAMLWDNTTDVVGKLALLVKYGLESEGIVRDIIGFYNSFADIIIAADGVVDKAETKAKAEFEENFNSAFSFFLRKLKL
ncbi:MAG: hypothetical protein IJJ99_01855 [Oscillospiraceae bacterium]|nr:hypothetical protein [Oscillospiraceae bacterium]